MKQKMNLDASTNWNQVLDSIIKNKFSSIYQNYSLKEVERGYLITQKDKLSNVFLFKKEIKIKIYFDDKYEEINIYSSLQIENFIKKKNKDINLLYIKEINTKFLDAIKNLGIYLLNHELELRKKNQLPKLKMKNPLDMEEDYSPEEYSSYFYKYLIYEDEKKKKEKIIFQNNEIRNQILVNMINMREDDKLNIFKFTGPSSIGKSFTLLRFSRVCFNMAYINLKVLQNLKNDLEESYKMIIHELERFQIGTNLDNLNKIIKSSYENNNSYCELLLNIMEFLNEINLVSIFIFDQFKDKYIEVGFIQKIKAFKNINIVQCSSINDKNIRKECIKTWIDNRESPSVLKIINQEYYFYFQKIYNYSPETKMQRKEIFKPLGYMPKYINKYKNYTSANKIYEDVKKHIDEKLDIFCKSNDIEKSFMFANLKYIVNKKYTYDELGSIIRYTPLKYFIIFFKREFFKIKPIFPLMYNIINYKLKETECDNFFKNELYKKNKITNDYVKGDYFESAAKYGLMKLKFPKNDDYQIITLNEIVSMDKIINDNDFIEDYEIENPEKEDDEDEEDINRIKNTIINNNISTKNDLEEINKNESFNNQEKIENIENIYSYMSKDNNSAEKIEDIEEKINQEIAQRKNKELEKLLNDFSIETKKKDIFIEEGLSDDAISFSKNIEDYRLDEIEEQRKREEKIEKSIFDGDESIFLDQFSKWGKALDFAYIYGKKNSKNFIGFQMKCYFENSDLNKHAIDRCWIKKNCRKVLVNSMKLFNCKITNWYYYLVFYYNSQSKNENINQKNIEDCRNNDISYFYYDPVTKKFYYPHENKYKDLLELKFDKNADLDRNITNIENFSYNIGSLGKMKIENNIQSITNSFVQEFKIALNLQKNVSILIILDKIKNKIDSDSRYNLLFHAKCNFNKSIFIPPDKNHVFLYKMKDTNKKINFMAVDVQKEKIKYIEISSGKELEKIYNVLDEDNKYFYCLYKDKIPNARKRIISKRGDIKKPMSKDKVKLFA